MTAQRRQMLRRAIAHIGFPAKARVVWRRGDHEAIAMFLGEEARRRNTRVERIAADDRTRRIAPFGQAIAIDQHFAGIEPQRLDRARHREEGRLQYVDAVDLGDARLANAPAATRLDLNLQLAAAFRGEFLAVVEPGDAALAQ